jgi:lysophospholipase L1-like esterase
MASHSPGDRNGDGSGPAEWRLADVSLLAAVAACLFVVVFWAALGKPPLAGTAVASVLGLIFASLANLSLGALASGAVIEWRHPDWSRLRGFDHVFMLVALVALVLADAGAGWWVFTSDAGGAGRWLFLGLALAAAAAGALWAWPGLAGLLLRRAEAAGGAGRRSRRGLWPQHGQEAPADEPWRLFTPLSGLLGGALGVVVAVAYLGISAWHENSMVPQRHPLPAALAGVHGGYVALGDSYSAGEGLPPFAGSTAADHCDRSVSAAYPSLLDALLRKQDPRSPFRFTACSGALLSEIFSPTRRDGMVYPPEISSRVQPSIGLVTLTIGGNNAIFSGVVQNCLLSGNCMEERFPPPGVSEKTARHVPPGKLLTQWGPGTIEQIGNEDAVLFRALRGDFPSARVVVVGYPYLFPSRSGPGFPYFPPECASILNRLSARERDGIRTLQDQLNDRIYEEAAAAGIEYVSPVAIWDGHEPCGSSGQYTNSVKPYFSFPNPINGGSFHPNAAGQQALAALLACYLDDHRQPPDPFAPGAPHDITVPGSRLVSPSELRLAAAPGLASVPGAGVIPGCAQARSVSTSRS